MTNEEMNAVSNELQVIKQTCYDQGRQDAIDDLNRQIANIQRAQETVGKKREEWEVLVKQVQASYLLNHDRKMNLILHNPTPWSYQEQHLSVPADVDEFVEEVSRLVEMGKDFEIMLKGIRENETLKKSWDQLLVAMRLIHR